MGPRTAQHRADAAPLPSALRREEARERPLLRARAQHGRYPPHALSTAVTPRTRSEQRSLRARAQGSRCSAHARPSPPASATRPASLTCKSMHIRLHTDEAGRGAGLAFKMAERGGRGSGGHGSLDKSITLPPDEIFRNLENAKRFAIDIGNRAGTVARRRGEGRRLSPRCGDSPGPVSFWRAGHTGTCSPMQSPELPAPPRSPGV